MFLPRVLFALNLIDNRALLSLGIKTESLLPLKRLRTNKDIRWTFSYLGLPNDPHSVKIDRLNQHSEDDVIDEDLITMIDDFDGKPRDDDMSMMVPTMTPTRQNIVTVEPTISNFPVHYSDSPFTDSPVVANGPSTPPISVIPVSLPSFRPDSKIPTSKMPSILPTDAKSRFPSNTPSIFPTIKSKNPTEVSEAPIMKNPTFVEIPSTSPSSIPSLSTESNLPSEIASSVPSILFSNNPTHVFSNLPSVGTMFDQTPSTSPTSIPSVSETTSQPTKIHSNFPSLKLTDIPTTDPSIIPSASPTIAYLNTLLPSQLPSSIFPTHISQLPTLTTNPIESPKPSGFPSSHGPIIKPTTTPIVSFTPTESPNETTVCGMSEDQRRDAIVEQISNAIGSNVFVLFNVTTPQSKALNWILEERDRATCPGIKLVQRWVMATFYFSTGGDHWFECSASSNATDDCGTMAPFVGKKRFLSEDNECLWAGIKCDMENCVTEIEFEFNNLIGTIPTEIGLLGNLELLGMEQGGLHGTIPTEIGRLSQLYFLDMDFNHLSGNLPSELFTLPLVEQLDLNNNFLSGSIERLGSLNRLEFLQLHNTYITGTVPSSIGLLKNLNTLTLHNTSIIGTVPSSVCQLRANGTLVSFITDCLTPNPKVVCNCCTGCRRGK